MNSKKVSHSLGALIADLKAEHAASTALQQRIASLTQSLAALPWQVQEMLEGAQVLECEIEEAAAAKAAAEHALEIERAVRTVTVKAWVESISAARSWLPLSVNEEEMLSAMLYAAQNPETPSEFPIRELVHDVGTTLITAFGDFGREKLRFEYDKVASIRAQWSLLRQIFLFLLRYGLQNAKAADRKMGLYMHQIPNSGSCLCSVEFSFRRPLSNFAVFGVRNGRSDAEARKSGGVLSLLGLANLGAEHLWGWERSLLQEQHGAHDKIKYELFWQIPMIQ